MMAAMSESVTRLRKTVVERALHGPGKTNGEQRRSAFDNRDGTEPARALIDKVTQHAWTVTDEDVTGVKAAGMTDDQIFELVVCAALGQSTRQLESALAALDAAMEDKP